ncbi:MAG: transposase [Nitrososphaerales archaeon]
MYREEEDRHKAHPTANKSDKARNGGKKIDSARHDGGGEITGFSGFALVVAFLLSLFGTSFDSLIPYLKCLLFSEHSINNSCNNGDSLYHISDGRARNKVYDALRCSGLAYEENITLLLKKAASAGMIYHMIDLSLDATHLLYRGSKKLKAWGAPFSTWLNRSFPGLNPMTACDLASGLFLYVYDFVCKSSLSVREYGKEKVMLGRTKKCINFLKKASIRIRSITGDEAFFSYRLLKWLSDSNKKNARKISYRIAVKSTSVLREYVPRIREWISLDNNSNDGGRLIGMFRGAMYRGIRTNLIAVKHHGKTFLYVTSTRSLDALAAVMQYWQRGKHEKSIGYLKSFLSLVRMPSTKLSKIKGHVFSCLLLYVLLRKIGLELNLGSGLSPATMSALLKRPGVVKIVKDERGVTENIAALIVVNRSLMRRIKRSRMVIGQSVIEFVEFRQSKSNKKHVDDYFPWPNRD